MKTIAHIIVLAFLFEACSKPGATQIPKAQIPVSFSSADTMSFLLNGVEFGASVDAQANGYVQGEVVIRANASGLENTLMLTFKPFPSDFATIDQAMTGYWDLGLSRPINKYTLSRDSTNFIRILSYDSTLTGEFNLTFVYQSDSTKVAIFTNGIFSAKVDTLYPFQYCIEG
jgi:hypothetical protein